MNLSNNLKRFDFLNTAADLAEKMNLSVYLVGGFVRDLLLKRVSEDIDILIVGDGNLYAKELAKQLGVEKVVTYKTFGTAHFIYDDFDFEFVTARKESYSRDSRKPNVVGSSFSDDINRRDFSINTLAVSVNKKDFGELIDSYDGLKDINNKIIKTPIDPLKTFDDDPLRILRAYRFAAQLNFSVDETINFAANKLKNRLEIVSKERITDELFKILASPKPSIGLKLLFKSGVLEVIFPEISNLSGVEQRDDFHHKEVFLHTCQVVDNISQITDDVWLRFAALVHDIAKPKTKRFIKSVGWTFHGHEDLGAKMMKPIFRKMRLPLNKLSYIEKLIRLHLRPIALAKEEVTDSAVRRLIVSAGEDLEDLIILCRADITSKNPSKVSKYLQNYENVMKKVVQVKKKDKLRAFQSPIKGDTIMEVCNLKPSKKVGDIKKAIEDAILDGKIGNNYEDAYAYLLRTKDELLKDHGNE
ncbi:MAG: CCA tRNA nucleotidyltransferase [Ignavibacteria bacterium]|nr:CCA tRNA nucleotidyltransferase [Ignavibacteria bacterium]